MDYRQFAKQVLIVIGLVTGITLLLWFIGSIFSVLLIIIAAVLVAVFFDGIARWIADRTPLSIGWSRVVSVFGVLIVVGAVVWLLAPSVTQQADQLSEQLPSSVQEVEQRLSKNPWGEKVVQYVRQKDFTKNLGSQSQRFFSAVFGVFGVLADIYIIYFMGFLILATPQAYVSGIIHLIPKPQRERADEVLRTLGQTLRSWLAGKLLSMLIVAVLTWIGLMIIGVPLALVLAISAGILAFVPNFGPLAALVLGVLVAATQGTQTMLWTALVYVAVQVIESNLLTPMIQRNKISLPMAMVLFAQLVLGVFTGVLGLVLATPIFAIVMMLVKMLYVEDVLDDHEQLLKPEKVVQDRQQERSHA